MMQMEERLEHLTRVMERGFDTLSDLLRDTNVRLDRAIERLDRHEAVLVRVIERLDRHEDVLVKLADNVIALNGRVDTLTHEVKSLNGEVKIFNGRFDSFLTGAHQ
jgi:calcineurin-like phosphoesterase family protein